MCRSHFSAVTSSNTCILLALQAVRLLGSCCSHEPELAVWLGERNGARALLTAALGVQLDSEMWMQWASNYQWCSSSALTALGDGDHCTCACVCFSVVEFCVVQDLGPDREGMISVVLELFCSPQHSAHAVVSEMHCLCFILATAA